MKKSKSIVFVTLTFLLSLLIGLSYGVFMITTGKYNATNMLISNLMYKIDISTTGGSETINGKTVNLSGGNTSTVLVKIESLNPIDTNYQLEYKITEGEGSISYASNTGWKPSGNLSKSNGLVYVKTVKVVIEATTNLTVDFNVSGGYIYDSNIIALVGYEKIINEYDKIYNYTEESNLKDIIEKETNCTNSPCLYGGQSVNNYLQYPSSTNLNENIWRITGTQDLEDYVALKLIGNIRSTTNVEGINSSLSNIYTSLEKKEDYIYLTNRFDCNETGCNSSNYENIGLLTTYEYNKIGGLNSYLALSNNFYSLNGTAIENITPSGVEETNDTTTSGIRPVIYLQSDVNVTGSGTASDPYRLSSKGDIIMASATLNNGPFKDKPEGYFPSESDPYIVKSVSCTNDTVGYWDEEKKTIILTTPNLPTTCTVDFSEGYTVEMYGVGATIGNPASQVVGRIGETTFNFTTNTGYNQSTANVTCDNGATGVIEGNTVNITNIKQSGKCTITLNKNRYTVNVTSNNTSYGTVSVDPIEVEHGESSVVTIMPASGYKYSSDTCNGTINENKITISDITENKDCIVTFNLDTSKLKTLADTIKTAYPPVVGRTNFSVIDNGTPTLYTGADDDGTTYYFSGDGSSMNNWVNFAGSKWRIIRINGSGSVRLLYSGDGNTGSEVNNYNGVGSDSGRSTYSINSSTYNHPSYVGWKYTVGGSLPTDRENGTPSGAYNAVSSWYSKNVTDAGLANYIDTEAIYCNDRSITSGSYSTSNLFDYAPLSRLRINNSPTFNCSSTSDSFTTFGLMTADEVVYAGGKMFANNTKAYYYLNASGNGSITGSNWWWTMSPCYWNGSGAGVFIVINSGSLTNATLVNSSNVIRPVISLKSNVLVTGGNGSGTSPYTVTLP